MPVPLIAKPLHAALSDARLTAIRLKVDVQRRRDASAAGPTARPDYLDLQRHINGAIVIFNESLAVSGLVAYGRVEYDNPALDLVAEYTAMRDAAVTLRQWIFDNIPRDAGSGAVLLYTADLSGRLVPLTVSAAATAGFRAACDTFLATGV